LHQPWMQVDPPLPHLSSVLLLHYFRVDATLHQGCIFASTVDGGCGIASARQPWWMKGSIHQDAELPAAGNPASSKPYSATKSSFSRPMVCTAGHRIPASSGPNAEAGKAFLVAL